MNIEWLVTDLTSVGYHARVERDIFGVIVCVFWPIRAGFVEGKPLYDAGITS